MGEMYDRVLSERHGFETVVVCDPSTSCPSSSDPQHVDEISSVSFRKVRISSMRRSNSFSNGEKFTESRKEIRKHMGVLDNLNVMMKPFGLCQPVTELPLWRQRSHIGLQRIDKVKC